MNETKELDNLRKILELAWQNKDMDNRGFGYDLVGQVALSINVSAQYIERTGGIKELAWKLHTRITDTKAIDLPTISIKTLYSDLKYSLDQFIINS